MAKASRSRDDDARALAASAAAPGAWAAPEPGASPGSSIVLTWDRSHGLHMIIPTPAKQDSFALSSSRRLFVEVPVLLETVPESAPGPDAAPAIGPPVDEHGGGSGAAGPAARLQPQGEGEREPCGDDGQRHEDDARRSVAPSPCSPAAGCDGSTATPTRATAAQSTPPPLPQRCGSSSSCRSSDDQGELDDWDVYNLHKIDAWRREIHTLDEKLIYEKARHEDDLAALADELSDTQRQLQASEAECARLRDANDFLQNRLCNAEARLVGQRATCEELMQTETPTETPPPVPTEAPPPVPSEPPPPPPPPPSAEAPPPPTLGQDARICTVPHPPFAAAVAREARDDRRAQRAPTAPREDAGGLGKARVDVGSWLEQQARAAKCSLRALRQDAATGTEAQAVRGGLASKALAARPVAALQGLAKLRAMRDLSSDDEDVAL